MTRVLVLGAGGPAGFNVCAAAAKAGHDVIGIDASELHLEWAKRVCGRVVVDDAPNDRDRLELLADLCEDATVAHAQPDTLALLLASSSGPWRTLIPPRHVMLTCHDKGALGRRWAAVGLLSQPPTVILDPYPDWFHVAADLYGLPFWLRATRGAGARGATLVETLEMGYHWLRYWQTRGASWEWVASEYLPGREYCWTGVFQAGVLLAGFARERLEWIYPHLAPSGRTGTPAAARTVAEADVNAVARAAIAAVDPRPNGVYCVDLVRDRDDRPRPTEINAGRFATTSPLYMQPGDHWTNLVDLFVRAAAGEHVEPVGDDCHPIGWTLLRHIDCGLVLLPPRYTPGAHD